MIHLSENLYNHFWQALQEAHPALEMCTLTSEAISHCDNTMSDSEVDDGFLIRLDGRVLGLVNPANSLYEFTCNQVNVDALLKAVPQLPSCIIRGRYLGEDENGFSIRRRFDLTIETQPTYTRLVMNLLGWSADQANTAYRQGNVIIFNKVRS